LSLLREKKDNVLGCLFCGRKKTTSLVVSFAGEKRQRPWLSLLREKKDNVLGCLFCGPGENPLSGAIFIVFYIF
jgi:4-hydroxy-3-methylbut-2-en-1-yl diphosphate synthase IspG/GcpE